jgi:hypothetical protein
MPVKAENLLQTKRSMESLSSASLDAMIIFYITAGDDIWAMLLFQCGF